MNNAVYIAWRSGGDADGEWGVIGKLEKTTDVYRFVYTWGARTLRGFQAFPGMTDLEKVYESDDLFPMFANRLLPKSRPEYEAFLTWSGFDPKEPPEPLALLSVTEGIVQTDSIELFPSPCPDATGCFDARFFLHGLRHAEPLAIEEANRLKPGAILRVELEDANPFDPKAVAIWIDGGTSNRIGYVPRYLARDVRTLLAECPEQVLELSVERVNFNAPLQMRVLCRLSTCWPESFKPCTGEEFQPIVDFSAAC